LVLVVNFNISFSIGFSCRADTASIPALRQASNVASNFKMTKLLLIISGLFFLSACSIDNRSKDTDKKIVDTLNQVTNVSDNWIFDKVDSTKLLFKNSKSFDTHLYELQYIGQINLQNKAPFLIFSGRDCNECDANISIYIHSPSDGQLTVDYGQNRYQYPGTERDYETDSLTYISRAFYGQVLDNTKGVIWYEKRLLENGKMGNRIFLTKVDNGFIKDTLYQDNGTIEQTISLLKKGLCKEIKGQQFSSEP